MKVDFFNLMDVDLWFLLPCITVEREITITNKKIVSLSLHFLCFSIAIDFITKQED